jgi:alanine racemase
MNRLGMEPAEWLAVRDIVLAQNPKLVMSHLACADEPGHAQNAAQLLAFKQMTDGISVPRSLAATGGILLAPDYHFDLTRPGIGVYGGLPLADAKPVVSLDLPIVQIRIVETGEAVGYGCSWVADKERHIATVSSGYADGLIRAMGGKGRLFSGTVACPIVGRVSMDLITVDITHLTEIPGELSILGPEQGVDTLANAAGTIGYEILTSLGARHSRRYREGL